MVYCVKKLIEKCFEGLFTLFFSKIINLIEEHADMETFVYNLVNE